MVFRTARKTQLHIGNSKHSLLPIRSSTDARKCNPPLVLGPIVHYLQSLDALNTSNQRVRDIMIGKAKEEIAPTGIFLWVDVRDVALAHVLAAELPEAANKRFLITAGHFCNKDIADITRDNFPELSSNMPSKDTKGGGFPEDGTFCIAKSRLLFRADVMQGFTNLIIHG